MKIKFSGAVDNYDKSTPINQKFNIKQVLYVLASAFVVFLGSQLLGAILVSAIGSIFGASTDTLKWALESSDWVRFLLILSIELITVWLIYIILKRDNLTLRSIGLAKILIFKHAFEAIKAYGLYFVIFLSMFSLLGSTGLIDTDQAQQLGFSSPTGIGLVFAFLSLVILPPIAEEILFRGYLYHRLKAYAPSIAALVTSLLFATAHLELGSGGSLNWAAALDTLILSYVLIYVTDKNKSLWPAIFLHAIKNCIAFVALFVIK